MKTNLIFKRQRNVGNKVETVTRIVSVDIPNIVAGEGWILSGHTDYVEVTPEVSLSTLSDFTVKDETIETAQQSILTTFAVDAAIKDVAFDPDKIVKFESNVQGTAKLVRSKGVIKIVARRGKTTFNQNTPNSVCINDFTKNEFFKNCREFHGCKQIYEFTLDDGRPYDYWNNVIDKEYIRQKNDYIKRATSN